MGVIFDEMTGGAGTVRLPYGRIGNWLKGLTKPDVERVNENEFYVLEDNCRTPSGVSYMLEDREAMMYLFPELFAQQRVAPVENYPAMLRKTLESVAPPACKGEPTIVLLTPGIHN